MLNIEDYKDELLKCGITQSMVFCEFRIDVLKWDCPKGLDIDCQTCCEEIFDWLLKEHEESTNNKVKINLNTQNIVHDGNILEISFDCSSYFDLAKTYHKTFKKDYILCKYILDNVEKIGTLYLVRRNTNGNRRK